MFEIDFTNLDSSRSFYGFSFIYNYLGFKLSRKDGDSANLTSLFIWFDSVVIWEALI